MAGLVFAMTHVEICRWNQLAALPECGRWLAELDQVFFSSSARQSFASAEEKAAFRERWLGRYLTHFPQCAFIALDSGGRAVGYVVGSLRDPVRDPLFADLTFLAHFGALTARYPAQLHINLDADWRSKGIGAQLVDAFSDLARSERAPGVHVVTAEGMRNVRFYLANGFVERATAAVEGRTLLFLGRDTGL